MTLLKQQIIPLLTEQANSVHIQLKSFGIISNLFTSKLMCDMDAGININYMTFFAQICEARLKPSILKRQLDLKLYFVPELRLN